MLGLILFLALMVQAVARRTPGIAQGPPAVPESAQLPVETRPKRELVGTISCSASVCHGGSGLGQPRSEATTWHAFDPHVRAYDTLLTRQSKAIAKHLWGEKTTAHEGTLCLKCHVHPDYHPEMARPNFRKEDGVGCESCHGAAQNWLTPHYRESGKQADKLALGFADTKSLAGRASVCVGCHVGTPGTEVDHDLIAAGHPALRFEFTTYFANLPPHWNVRKDKDANSTDAKKLVDFEARAWAIGQFITTASALELLRHRMDPKAGKPWPEFADLDCFACHHDLKAKSWRQHDKHLGQRRPGALAWNNWYYAMLPDVLAVSHATKVNAAAESFAAGRDRLERNLFAEESRRDLAKQAKDLATALRDVARSQRLAPGDSWLDRLTLERPFDKTWDDATQRYLALLAVRQMRKDNQDPEHAELERFITDLRKDVTFRAFNSPRDFVPAGLQVMPKE